MPSDAKKQRDLQKKAAAKAKGKPGQPGPKTNGVTEGGDGVTKNGVDGGLTNGHSTNGTTTPMSNGVSREGSPKIEATEDGKKNAEVQSLRLTVDLDL